MASVLRAKARPPSLRAAAGQRGMTAFLWEQASWWLRHLLRSAWRHARWLEGDSMKAALTRY
jgi:hypothetical protein